MPRKISHVTFQKEFFSDLSADNMIFAVTVRSPVKSGKLISIFHPSLPEGYSLIKAQDVPGSNEIKFQNSKIPLFCSEKISYKGEPLALLVGPNEEELSHLLNDILIEIDEDDAKDEEIEPLILGKREKKFGPCFNQKSSQQSKDSTDTQNQKDNDEEEDELKKIFDSSPYVFEHEWTYALKEQNYGEPNGAFCTWKKAGKKEKQGENLTISTPTQWLNNLRKTASEALSIKPDSIVIRKTTSTNRSTNNIWYNSIIATQAAVASKKTGKPVKLVYSQKEQENFMNRMLPIVITHKTAANEKGEIEAMQIKIEVDIGFTNPFAQEIADRLAIAASGCYNPKNLSVSVIAKSSSNPASSVDMQKIDSAAFFACENQMSEMSRLCKMTPIEFRLKNHIEIDFTKRRKPKVPFIFDIEKFDSAIESLTKSSDFSRKYTSYMLDSAGWKIRNEEAEDKNVEQEDAFSLFASPIRGIGFACAFEGTGYSGSGILKSTQSMEVTLESETSMTIYSPPVSQAIQEIWTKTAEEILGVQSLNCKIDSTVKRGEEPPLPENIYSNISLMTSLLKKCCFEIKKKKATEKLPFTVKKRNSKSNEWNMDEFEGKPFHSLSFIAMTIEIELDPCTYREKIRRIDLVVSSGKILNLQAATQAIKLGIQKELFSLLKDDRLECENINIAFVQSEKDPSQIGELVHQVIPSAYSQALTQILACTIDSLPLSVESLYNKIKEQREKEDKIEVDKETKMKESENILKEEIKD